LFEAAKKFEYATLAFGALYQLGAGLAYLEGVGMDRIETHTVGLAQRMHAGLSDRGFEMLTPPGNRSSIVAFTNTKPEAARQVFADAGIDLTLRENGAEVRVSAALFNTAAEIDAFLDASEALV
jgi:selenocysteine lyase/cysteine desulfurase